VISITDGQCFLETDLFYQGIRPAINAGISVSRVGGNAQVKAMRKIAGPLRLNLAQFRELAAFAEFGSELDASSLAQLERGRRVVEVLKQTQYAPVPVEEQIISIYAVTTGMMDSVPTEDIDRFELGLRQFVGERFPDLLEHIGNTGDLPDEDRLKEAISSFKETFQATDKG
jgi:F-type H+-transporting ATPase subunit alpha